MNIWYFKTNTTQNYLKKLVQKLTEEKRVEVVIAVEVYS